MKPDNKKLGQELNNTVEGLLKAALDLGGVLAQSVNSSTPAGCLFLLREVLRCNQMCESCALKTGKKKSIL